MDIGMTKTYVLNCMDLVRSVIRTRLINVFFLWLSGTVYQQLVKNKTKPKNPSGLLLVDSRHTHLFRC